MLQYPKKPAHSTARDGSPGPWNFRLLSTCRDIHGRRNRGFKSRAILARGDPCVKTRSPNCEFQIILPCDVSDYDHDPHLQIPSGRRILFLHQHSFVLQRGCPAPSAAPHLPQFYSSPEPLGSYSTQPQLRYPVRPTFRYSPTLFDSCSAAVLTPFDSSATTHLLSLASIPPAR